MKLSAVIITYNEEKNIMRCLKSLNGVVDEILVVDSFSTDRTKEICESMGARFVVNTFEGHIEQKNFAMSQAANDWVLSLDADEELTPELRESLILAKAASSGEALQFNRLTNYCGKWIRHGGWYPDRKIRVWDRRKGKWGGVNPHDTVVLEAGVTRKHISGDLLHYSYYSLSEHVNQIDKFSSIAAEHAFQKGKRANLVIHIFLGPFYSFLKKYVLQLGFLDGYFGFVIAINTGFYRYLKYIKLREIQKNNGSGTTH